MELEAIARGNEQASQEVSFERTLCEELCHALGARKELTQTERIFGRQLLPFENGKKVDRRLLEERPAIRAAERSRGVPELGANDEAFEGVVLPHGRDERTRE